MGMILRIASSRIVGQGDIVGRSGYFSLNLSAKTVMRGRLDARRTLKSLVADLRISKQVKLGKLYIGESAGAIIASPNAEYMRSVNFDPIEKAPELKDCTSLDLVDFYTIPHYGNFPFKKKGEKIVQLYNEKLQLIPISNKQAVIIEDSNIQIKDAK